jgi:hypothetical protein
MPSVSLHIGLPKTATSTIQSWLHQNRHLLRKHGVFVPDRPIYAHRLAVELLSGPRWDTRPDIIEIRQIPLEEARGGFLKSLASRDIQTTVISSEYFYYCDTAQVAASMRQQFGTETDVVVYIRSQCELALSGYNQDIKRLGKTTSRPKPAYHALYDWRLLLDGLAQHFGKEHVKPVSFDISARNQTILSDFVTAACPSIGRQFAEGVFQNVTVQNESLPADMLEFKRLANMVGETSIFDYEWLEAALRAGYKGPRFGVSAEEAAAWRSIYAEGNQYVAREYFNGAMAEQVFPVDDQRVAGVDLEGQLSLETVAKLLAFHARRHEEHHKDLTRRLKAVEAQLAKLLTTQKEVPEQDDRPRHHAFRGS